LGQIEGELEGSDRVVAKGEAGRCSDCDAEGTQLPEGLLSKSSAKKSFLAAQAVIEARRRAARESGRVINSEVDIAQRVQYY